MEINYLAWSPNLCKNHKWPKHCYDLSHGHQYKVVGYSCCSFGFFIGSISPVRQCYFFLTDWFVHQSTVQYFYWSVVWWEISTCCWVGSSAWSRWLLSPSMVRERRTCWSCQLPPVIWIQRSWILNPGSLVHRTCQMPAGHLWSKDLVPVLFGWLTNPISCQHLFSCWNQRLLGVIIIFV